MPVQLNVLYEDENLLAVDKPPGVNSDNLKGRIHRLDQDTSGVLLIAKNKKALDFFQKQFKQRRVKKKYLALVIGTPKLEKGEIKGLIGRSPNDRRKQKVFSPLEPGAEGKREAITKYRVIKKFKRYTLVEAEPKTGRKHQIRAHFAYLGHPLAGDKLYGFKNQPQPKGLKRHFLHASQIKIKLPSGKEKEIISPLPEDLKKVLKNI